MFKGNLFSKNKGSADIRSASEGYFDPLDLSQKQASSQTAQASNLQSDINAILGEASDSAQENPSGAQNKASSEAMQNITNAQNENVAPDKEQTSNIQINPYVPLRAGEDPNNLNENLDKSDTNKNEHIKTMPQSNAPKTEALTMLDAIKQKAGDKELEKWRKKLGTPAQTTNISKDPKEKLLENIEAKDTNAEDKKEKYKYSGTIRTFKMDVQELMSRDKLSLAKIVAIESDKRKIEQKAEKVKKEKQVISFAMILLIFAVFITFSIFAFAIYTNKKLQEVNNDVIAQNQAETSLLGGIIFVEDRLSIDITDRPNFYVLQVIQAAVYSKQIVDIIGNMTEIALFRKTQTGEYRRIKMEELLDIIYPKASSVFKEITAGPDYMLGVHITSDRGRSAFLVFKTESYAYAVSEMLEWEKDMLKTLGPIMIPKYKYGQTEERFQDAVLKNYNVRVVKYPNGKIKFMYGFVGQDTVIITNNPKTFIEVAKRVKIEKGL